MNNLIGPGNRNTRRRIQVNNRIDARVKQTTPETSTRIKRTVPKAAQAIKQARQSVYGVGGANPYLPKQKPVFHWQWKYQYAMTGFSLVMSAFAVLLCGLDLVFGWPMFRASMLFDIVFFASGVIMFALSWAVYKDLPKIARHGNWHRCDGMQGNVVAKRVGV